MTLSFVGYATQASGNTVTIPNHQAGDLIIIYASRGNATAPGIGFGFTSLQTMANGSYSYRVGYRIAASWSTTSGTWTNASRLMVFVYRSTTSFRLPRFVGGWLSSTPRAYDWPAPTSALEDEYLLRHLYSSANTVTGYIPPAHAEHVNAGSGLNFYQAWMVGSAPITGTAAAYVSPGSVPTYIAGQIAVGEYPAWPGYEDDFNAETLDPFWEDNSANMVPIVGIPSLGPPAMAGGRIEFGELDLPNEVYSSAGIVSKSAYVLAPGDTLSFQNGYQDGVMGIGILALMESPGSPSLQWTRTDVGSGDESTLSAYGSPVATPPPAEWVRFRVTSTGTLTFETADAFDGTWTTSWESAPITGIPFHVGLGGLGVWVDNFNTAGATPIPAFVGTVPVSAIKVGAADATAIYLGATKLWP